MPNVSYDELYEKSKEVLMSGVFPVVVCSVFAMLCIHGMAQNIYECFGLPASGIGDSDRKMAKLSIPCLGMERITIRTDPSNSVISSFTIYKVCRPCSNDVEVIERETWELRDRLCEKFRCVRDSTKDQEKRSWFEQRFVLIDYVGWTARVSAFGCSTTCDSDGRLIGTNYMVRCRFENRWLEASSRVEEPIGWSKEDDLHYDPLTKKYYIYSQPPLRKVYLENIRVKAKDGKEAPCSFGEKLAE